MFSSEVGKGASVEL